MDISSDSIKLLREKSGAGMVDCKNALAEADGDLEKAAEILRKKGIVKAGKRTSRETAEGVIRALAAESGRAGYIFELNSETDFVARNQKFLDFAGKIADLIREKEPVSLAVLLGLPFGKSTVKESLEALSGVIGEKLVLRRYEVLRSQGAVGAYTHANSRLAVIAAINAPGRNSLAGEIAMQVAASNPSCLEPSDVAPEELEKEKAIYREQLKNEGKPENIVEKILAGKINKYFDEVCLTRQEYIKDDKQKVSDILKGAKVEKFIRYSL